MPKVWICTWGTRGDHDPAAALAFGLQSAGHTVTVFGTHRLRYIYSQRGVNFLNIDDLHVLHPGNVEAKKLLLEQAAAAGFEGADAVEEYLFDVFNEWFDFNEWFPLSRLLEGKSIPEVTFESGPSTRALTELMCFGGGLDKLPETRRSRTEFLAKRQGVAVEDYKAKASKLRKAQWQLFAQHEGESHMSPLDTMLSWRSTFGLSLLVSLMPQMGEGGPAVAQKFKDLVHSFHEWEDAEDLKQSLDNHYKKWLPTFPTFDGQASLGRGITETQIFSLYNMKLSYSSCKPEERPDLVICHSATLATALYFKEKCGVNAVLWWSLPHLYSHKAALDTYNSIVVHPTAGPEKPLIEFGPLKFLDLVFGSQRTLLSMSPLRTKNYHDYRLYLKKCCTGTWVLDSKADTTLDSKLEAFLAANEGPVCFGWGSMPAVLGHSALERLVIKTQARVDKPAIFIMGCCGVTEDSFSQTLAEEYKDKPDLLSAAKARICLVKHAPHELLLPRTCCVVFHGGIGTCHAVLRAGVPGIISPVLLDQPSNADWMQALGCGVKVASQDKLTDEELSNAIVKVTSEPSYLATAKELAVEVTKEHGVARAVEMVEGFLKEGPLQKLETGPVLVNGMYRLFKNDGFPLPIPPMRFVAVDPDKVGLFFDSPVPSGYMRGGKFVIEAEEDTEAGTYNVQASWQNVGVVRWGKLSEDRKRATWSDGSYHQFISD